jgi:hypothetical protein
MTSTHRPTADCKKCKGTGFLSQFAHVDFGRCWSCGSGNDIVYLTDAEFQAMMDERTAARHARRDARRAARAS